MKIKVVEKKMGRKKLWGQAHFDRGEIDIDPRLKGKKHLEILLHEALHIIYQSEDEDRIVKDSIALTNLIWEQSYRRVDDDNSIPLQDGKHY